jgi:uncharacterized protein YcbX
MLGTVTALRRYPVKSMMGEDVDASDVSYSGLAWERRLALVSRRTSKVTSAKYPRLWRDLLSVNQHIGPERSRTPEGVSTGTCVTVLCQDMVDTGRVGWLVRRRQAADSDADPPEWATSVVPGGTRQATAAVGTAARLARAIISAICP